MIYIGAKIMYFDLNDIKMLQVYLKYYGVISMIIIPTIPFIFREIFMWEPRNTPLEIMTVSIYFVLGIQMLNISRNPEPHKAFIDFIIVASFLHSAIMLLFAESINHILFDVIPIASMAVWPLIFYPWGLKKFFRY